MSGAGPSIAAYCTDMEDQVANAMVGSFAKNGLNAIAKVLEIDSTGATVSDSTGKTVS